MSIMIWKVLKNNINKGQILGVFFGITVGLFILTASICFYLDIKPIFEDKSGFWKDEYIIINKKIFLSNTLSQVQSKKNVKPTFSTQEIEEIKNQRNVKDVAGFSNCSFKISAYSDDNNFMPDFYTELFFEAVPDKYIDVNYKNWKWSLDTNFVPIIIPKSYLNLYNFGFAQSQNLPQISEDVISTINLKLSLRGNSKRQWFNTRIIGFSERINTILVPKSFVDWANVEFGSEANPSPGQLLVVVKDPTNQDFFNFLEKNNYDVNKSEINNSKALAFLKIIISIILIIGLIIVVMAFSIMLISIQLLLQRNAENIKKLTLLGFSNNEITKPYFYFITILFLIIYIVSTIFLFVIRKIYLSTILMFGYNLSDMNFFIVASIGFVFIVVIVTLLFVMIYNNIIKISKQ